MRASKDGGGLSPEAAAALCDEAVGHYTTAVGSEHPVAKVTEEYAALRSQARRWKYGKDMDFRIGIWHLGFARTGMGHTPHHRPMRAGCHS